jgi:hypothetical protein
LHLLLRWLNIVGIWSLNKKKENASDLFYEDGLDININKLGLLIFWKRQHIKLKNLHIYLFIYIPIEIYNLIVIFSCDWLIG